MLWDSFIDSSKLFCFILLKSVSDYTLVFNPRNVDDGAGDGRGLRLLGDGGLVLGVSC